MRGILLLVIILIWCKEIKGKETTENLGFHRYELASAEHSVQKRSVSDIWNSIKKTANHAWRYLNSLINITGKKFEDWVTKIKIKAQDLRKTFGKHLKKMKDGIRNMMKNLTKTGELVKKCVQQRKEDIDELLKNILMDVTDCISNNFNHLNNLVAVYEPIPNQTDILKGVQNNVNVCMSKYKTHDDVEECIHAIREGIYKNIEITEENILQNHTAKRGASDDILNTIVGCTTDGIIKSTTIIASETVHVIECVSQQKKPPPAKKNGEKQVNNRSLQFVES